MKIILAFFALFLTCWAGVVPTIRPVQIYSGFTDIQIDEVDVYFINLTCFADVPGTFILNVDQPNIFDQISGAYMFISNGPTSGQYAPFPDPNSSGTYTWSTLNGTYSPLPSVSINNAGGMQLYITIDCPNGELCLYVLSTTFFPSSQTDISQSKSEEKVSPSLYDVDYPTVPKNAVQKDLFFSNSIVLNATVPYNTPIQFEIPYCPSALISQFGTTPVCLIFTVVGQGSDYIFYQQVSTNPSTGENVPKWNTRKPNPNPYLDYSGDGDLPINRWISLSFQVAQLPPFLYHTIYGLGGKGTTPPFENPFIVTYEVSSNCPTS